MARACVGSRVAVGDPGLANEEPAVGEGSSCLGVSVGANVGVSFGIEVNVGLSVLEAATPGAELGWVTDIPLGPQPITRLNTNASARLARTRRETLFMIIPLRLQNGN